MEVHLGFYGRLEGLQQILFSETRNNRDAPEHNGRISDFSTSSWNSVNCQDFRLHPSGSLYLTLQQETSPGDRSSGRTFRTEPSTPGANPAWRVAKTTGLRHKRKGAREGEEEISDYPQLAHDGTIYPYLPVLPTNCCLFCDALQPHRQHHDEH
ncbi:hypothetical protein Salat_2624900 [Sesamum alatum]|uniref:Uncharacterized protein n=1 Tax=Sesamum alatum TaxID=300844 RepID=A0AAE1XNJ3_9LAMI|nr:hypothetical protein Salat_2624900 [Sesamum alatum]